MRSIVIAIIMLSLSSTSVLCAEVRAVRAGESAVEDADRVQSDDEALSRMIAKENAELTRKLKGICRGC